MEYTLTIAATFICDLALLCGDIVISGNLWLWLAVHIAEILYITWLLKKSV